LNSEDAAAWALTQRIFAVQGRDRTDTRVDAAVSLHLHREVFLHAFVFLDPAGLTARRGLAARSLANARTGARWDLDLIFIF